MKNETGEGLGPLAGGTEANSADVNDCQEYKPAGGQKQAALTCDPEAAVNFLQWLRPGGPWVLTAIIPDGPTLTITATTEADVVKFVREHDGKRNLYYSVNPTRTAMSSKPCKADISHIEYIHIDGDPKTGETPEAAKARYVERFQFTGLRPTTGVDSGNGLNGLYRLDKRIEIPEPSSPEAAAIITDVESRTRALLIHLGAPLGTQNIDRILRLPGTTNLPNKAKVKAGRTPCRSQSLWLGTSVYPLAAFPLEKEKTNGAGDNHDGDDEPDHHSDDKLADSITHGGAEHFDGDRSKAVWFVIMEMLRRGHCRSAIKKTLLNRNNKISDHIYDQAKPAEYAKRQVDKAVKEIDFSVSERNHIKSTPNNIRVALVKLNIQVAYDTFADRTMLSGLAGFGPVLDDAAIDRIWLTISERFHFTPGHGLLFTVIRDTARLNSFHPVLDYLDGLVWDGVKRIDTWLTRYAGAEDSEYTRAVGGLYLTAAVRRVRKPGCKFDEMLLFEQSQGTDKSTALNTLAVHDAWFTDSFQLNADSKRVIEDLRGKWIVEAPELSGMGKADVEHLKALLSRREDRARMSYDRLVTDRPRQCVFAGTTNSSQYLKDTTGNRRYWPVAIKKFDVTALRADRDQLWAEAAAREATGISIRLAEELWSVAAEQQVQRLADDPFYETLQEHLGHFNNVKIASSSVWVILDIKEGQRTQVHKQRMGEAMKRVGWRHNTSRMISVAGRKVTGYVKGESSDTHPFKLVVAERVYTDGKHLLSVQPVEADAEQSTDLIAAMKASEEVL